MATVLAICQLKLAALSRAARARSARLAGRAGRNSPPNLSPSFLQSPRHLLFLLLALLIFKSEAPVAISLLRSAISCRERGFKKAGVVVHFALNRDHCTAFRLVILPLQVAPSLACSVASLSLSPGSYLPDRCCLRCRDLADYLLV